MGAKINFEKLNKDEFLKKYFALDMGKIGKRARSIKICEDSGLQITLPIS